MAIEWYQANGLANPHPWTARDSRKALRIWPPTTVTMHCTPPMDHPTALDTPAWNVVAIEWYQTNGLASPHPWKARDSRKALRVCPPTAVNSTSHLPSTTGHHDARPWNVVAIEWYQANRPGPSVSLTA